MRPQLREGRNDKGSNYWGKQSQHIISGWRWGDINNDFIFIYFLLVVLVQKKNPPKYLLTHIVACGWEVVGGHVNSGVVLCPCPGTLGGRQWPVWRADWPGKDCQEDHAPCADIAEVRALLRPVARGHWVTGMLPPPAAYPLSTSACLHLEQRGSPRKGWTHVQFTLVFHWIISNFFFPLLSFRHTFPSAFLLRLSRVHRKQWGILVMFSVMIVQLLYWF